MRAIVLLSLCACGSASTSSIELVSGSFEGDRQPVIDGTVMAWNDQTTFNNGYQPRDEAAFELVATQSIFNPEQDLLSMAGGEFLDAVHAFRFGDGLHLRINEARSLREGERLHLNAEQGSDRWQLVFKMGAEPIRGNAEVDDPRRGFRLPGAITATLNIDALSRDEDQAITSLEATLSLSVDRCPPSEHQRGEGEAYRPGEFVANLKLKPMSERLAEHNLKLLLGLSPLPLPDNNGFEFPGFTRNCRNNPRPPID